PKPNSRNTNCPARSPNDTLEKYWIGAAAFRDSSGLRVRGGFLRKGGTDVDPFLEAAIREARQGLAEGGIPIGSVLVIDGRNVGRGHNRRVQKESAILHAEMDCIENAGRLIAG